MKRAMRKSLRIYPGKREVGGAHQVALTKWEITACTYQFFMAELYEMGKEANTTAGGDLMMYVGGFVKETAKSWLHFIN